MNDIKVSVIVPVYGVEPYLSRCLDSLTGQTLKEIEIIVVNDCSPDCSQAIIQRYAAKDHRIVSVCNEKNVGQGLSRMRGLQLARGEYVAFADSDDYVELDMYEVLYTHATENDYDVVGSDLSYVLSENEIRCNRIEWNDLKRIDSDYILAKLFDFENSKFIPSSMCDKIYRLSFLKGKGISIVSERDYFLEDLIFNIDFFINKPQVGWVSRSLYHYVIRNGSTMYSFRKNFLHRYLSMYDRIGILLQAHNRYEEFRRHLNYNLFITTFAFISNNFSAPVSMNVKVRDCFSMLRNRRLKENMRRFSMCNIPFHSSGAVTKLCKCATFIIMKYL